MSVLSIDVLKYIDSDNYGTFSFLSLIMQGGRNKELQADFIIFLIKCEDFIVIAFNFGSGYLDLELEL